MSGQGPAVRRPTPHPRYERPYCDSRSFPSSAVIVHRPRPVTTPPGSSTDRGKPSCRPRLARSRAGPRTTNKVTGWVGRWWKGPSGVRGLRGRCGAVGGEREAARLAAGGQGGDRVPGQKRFPSCVLNGSGVVVWVSGLWVVLHR